MPPSIPSAPVLGYSFTANSTNNPTSQQPGVQIDAEFNRTNGAVGALIAAVSVSFNADGSLKSSAVQSAYEAGTGATYGGENLADAPSAASALLAQAWAEHMPDTLPADTLASSAITGQHWSARWWAQYAGELVGQLQTGIPAGSGGLLGGTDTSGRAVIISIGANLTLIDGVLALATTLTGGETLASGTLTGVTTNTGTIAGGVITDLSSPTNASDAATKGYVDTSIQAIASVQGLVTKSYVDTSVQAVVPASDTSHLLGATGTAGTARAVAIGTGLSLSTGGVLSATITSGATALSGLTDVAETSLTDGDRLHYNATTGKWVNGREPYIVSGFVPGVLTASQVLFVHKFAEPVTFPTNFGTANSGGTSGAEALANATNPTVITVQKCVAAADPTVSGNWTSVCTITFAASSTSATFSSAGVASFAKGDKMRAVGPASPDATLASPFVTLAGDR